MPSSFRCVLFGGGGEGFRDVCHASLLRFRHVSSLGGETKQCHVLVWASINWASLWAFRFNFVLGVVFGTLSLDFFWVGFGFLYFI